MEMNAYDYVLKKRIGYFAFRYLKYLEKNYSDALEQPMKRKDCAAALSA